MKFDLIRPCPRCPFRADIPPYLRPDFVVELRTSLERGTFACHETVDYGDDDGGQIRATSQHCAGALLLNERDDRRSDVCQVLARLGHWHPERLDRAAPVYASWDAMERATCAAHGVPWHPMSDGERRRVRDRKA